MISLRVCTAEEQHQQACSKVSSLAPFLESADQDLHSTRIELKENKKECVDLRARLAQVESKHEFLKGKE